MVSTSICDDDCVPAYMRKHRMSSIYSYFPFIATFSLVFGLATHIRLRKASRVSTTVCAITLALSTVLVELILCEISDLLDQKARAPLLRITLSGLMILIILVIPSLEIFASLGPIRFRLAFSSVVLGTWLGIFWYLPYSSIIPAHLNKHNKHDPGILTHVLQGSLKRTGIIGIALMASLAGFAAISSIWQILRSNRRTIVNDADLARKQAGLFSVQSMLEAKQNRLKTMTVEPKSFWGGWRGNNERAALEMEVNGLETMEMSLQSSLAAMQSAFEDQKRSGCRKRLANSAAHIFAIYCLYRLVTVGISILQRMILPQRARTATDPISNVLALLTTHYDPKLDHEAWSRQISFGLSGVMLLLSFSTVLQTFRLFSRFSPGLFDRFSTRLPLLISHTAGTYVVSSALLIRSNLPPKVRGVITDALGAPLDPRSAEVWFEGWFVVTAVITIVGLQMSRAFTRDDWDVEDVEMGKMM